MCFGCCSPASRRSPSHTAWCSCQGSLPVNTAAALLFARGVLSDVASAAAAACLGVSDFRLQLLQSCFEGLRPSQHADTTLFQLFKLFSLWLGAHAGSVGFHSGAGQADSGWGCCFCNMQMQASTDHSVNHCALRANAGSVGFHSGAGQPDSGWGCGFRNIQMQTSKHLAATHCCCYIAMQGRWAFTAALGKQTAAGAVASATYRCRPATSCCGAMLM